MRFSVLKMSAMVPLLLTAFGCGGGDDPGVKHLYVEPVGQEAIPGDPFGGTTHGGLSRVQRAIARGPVESNIIVLEEGDTLNLISEWSGISVESLLEDNLRVRDFGLVPGDAFVLMLSRSEFLDFLQLREANRIKHKVMRQRNVEIDHVIDYVVQKGDTSASIAATFNAPLELFESMNPLAKNLSLQPGQVVKVPIMKGADAAVPEDVAGQKGGRERPPGPAAPNKTLIPMPPQNGGKTLLTGPQPEAR